MLNSMKKETTMKAAFKREIRLDLIFKTIWKCKWRYILPLVLTFALTAGIMLSIPRYYQVRVMLAPEYSNGGGNMGGLSGVAGMLGVNLGGMNSSDAIAPQFYPDLIQSTDFLVPMMQVQVQTVDSTFKGRYVDYLTKKCEAPFWAKMMLKMKARFSKVEHFNADKNDRPNPFQLTKAEDKIVEGIAGSINCMVDKKTDVITITTTAQDPLVAAQLADTVMSKLQQFIIDYRTKKARIDLDHITKLCAEAHRKYEAACKDYAKFVDTHQDLVLQEYRNEEEQLENEMQMQFNAYNSLKQQMVVAESKVQERIPAFTVLQNASVPVKHAGPKRMITVAAMLMLCFFVCTIYFLLKYNKEDVQPNETDETEVEETDAEEYIADSENV